MFQKYDLLGWTTLVVSFLLINVYCLNINLNADSSFPLRYISALFDSAPHLISVQPGSRIFPEWFYSAIVSIFTSHPLQWLRGVILINITVLLLSLYYFCRTLQYTATNAKLICSLILSLIPALNIFHHNVLVYFVFSPGIHGFYIAYIIFSFALTYQILTAKQTTFQMLFYFLIVSLCAFSNVAFLLAVLPSCVLLIIWLKAKSQIHWKPILSWSVITVIAIVASNILISAVDQLDSIILMSQSQPMFEVGIKPWLFENNRLYHQLNDRTVSGYSFEILLFSVITSLIILIKSLFRKAITNSVVVNLLFIPWLFVFLLAMWSINKGNVRWIPFLLLFSPFILLSNLNYLIHWIKFRYLSTLCWVFITAGVISFILFKKPNTPYIRYHQIIPILESLRSQNKINQFGLADYWVGNMAHDSDFELAPISSSGRPRFFATNLFKAWSWDGQKLQRKKMTFLVNVCGENMKCAFDEEKLSKTLGPFDEKINKPVGNKAYLIYIYKEGINLSAYYDYAESIIKQQAPTLYSNYLTQ